ncbi:MAG: hypothetical protein AAGB48_08280 [Planctomycetota bacterium]
MTMTGGFSIPRSSGACAATEAVFQGGEPIVVVLLEPEGAEAGVEFDRLDVLRDAWDEHAGQLADRRVFASWHALAPTPGQAPPPILSADGMLDLFEQLGSSEDSDRLALRYVIALQLLRKRRLEYAGASPGELRVRVRGSEPEAEPIVVADPQSAGGLTEAALAALAEQVEALLEPAGEV